MKTLFTNLITNVSKTYKECSNSNNEAYLKGKKEAFEEILNWFVNSHNGELKYISATSFFNMIQEKLAKTKAALNAADENEEDIKPINFAEIKISDNRKRVNRYAERECLSSVSYNPFNEEESSQAINNLSNNNQNLNNFSFPFSIHSLNEQNNHQTHTNNTLNTTKDTEMSCGPTATFSNPFSNNSNNSNNFSNNLNSSGSSIQPFNSQGSKKKRK